MNKQEELANKLEEQDYQVAQRIVGGAASALAVPRDIVEALHDLVQVVAAVINEFTDPVDKGALRDAEQYLLDVAMKHDQLGGYGLYAGFGEEGRT